MAYYSILGIPLVIIGVGVALLLLRAKFRTARLGVACVIIGGVCGIVTGLYVLTAPGNEQLATQERLLFSANSTAIRSITIEPAHIGPARANINLTQSKTVITDRKPIDVLMKALRVARRFGPDHPFAKWSCLLTIEDGLDSVVVQVDDTKSQKNGLILYLWSNRNQGWLIETYRCDDLGPVLEKLVSNPPANGAIPKQ